MHSGDHTTSVSATRHALSGQETRAAEFCPHYGWQADDTSYRFHEEIRCLLARRLKHAAAIVFFGFATFFVRNLIVEEPSTTHASVRIFHALVTLLSGGLAGLLYARPCMSVRQLRFCELLLFAMPAGFFVWMQHCQICLLPHDKVSAMADTYLSETLIPWLILIQIYALFIPNTWKRATWIVGLMALAPLGGAVATGFYQPAIAQALIDGSFSGLFLWMALASIVAVYGTHRVGAMRREAFDARRVGLYTLRKKLGEGGMGEVYLAEHRLLKRPCAIKLIRPSKAGDPLTIARFESEVQSTARLTHMNTIEIYDYGITEDGTFYYAMEYLPGLNLQEMVDRFGPLPPERVVHLLRQVCSALREAHSAGLVHRDIKPGNIFAAERGGIYDVAKLLDFGLVKSVEPADDMQITIEGAVVGSPMYAPPERTLGDAEVDARGDIYSLGATAYFLLSGRPVFSGRNALKVMFAHASESPTPLPELCPDVPDELNEIVMTCLAKSPEHRYRSVGELEDALAHCAFRTPAWTQERAAAWWSQVAVDRSPAPEAASNELTVTMVLGVPA